jgi:hypothetical protein
MFNFFKRKKKMYNENNWEALEDKAIDSPDSMGTVNLKDRKLDPYMDPYYGKKFILKNSGLELKHLFTMSTSKGYDIYFDHPVTKKEVIFSDENLPKYVILDEINSKGTFDIIDDDEMKTKIENEFGELKTKPIEKIMPAVEKTERIAKEKPKINHQDEFKLLQKIKKIQTNVNIDIDIPNPDIFKQIWESLDISVSRDEYENLIKALIDLNIEDYKEKMIEKIKSLYII